MSFLIIEEERINGPCVGISIEAENPREKNSKLHVNEMLCTFTCTLR